MVELRAAAPDLEPGRRRPAGLRVPLHGQRFPGRDDRRDPVRARRLVHGAASAELRRPHARGGRVPGRRGCGAARRERDVRLLRLRGRGGSGHRPGDPYVRPGLQRGVGGDRHRAGARSRLRVPVRQPVRRLPRRGQRLAVRQLPRDHAEARCSCSCSSRWWRSLCSPSSPGPCSSRRSTRPSRRREAYPTRLLSIGFLVLLAVAAGEAAQITGALLVFALLVVPPAVAQTLTPHPGRSIAIAVVVGLLVVWVSLFVAYYSPYPIGFFLTSVAFVAYLAARGWRGLRRRPVGRCSHDRDDRERRRRADPSVHAARVPRRYPGGGPVGPGRLLHGAAQPGLHR